MALFGWDLPPGVSESDIPGNRPEDVWHENFVERIAGLFKDACLHGESEAAKHLEAALKALNSDDVASEVRAEVEDILNGPSRDGAGEFDHDEVERDSDDDLREEEAIAADIALQAQEQADFANDGDEPTPIG